MTFELPQLNYEYSALEPHIDAKTMEIHHSKHHQGYIDKLNKALEGTTFEGKELDEILKNIESFPEDKRTVIINNGGGHANHSLFWEILTNNKTEMSESLKKTIDETFGSFDEFKTKFIEVATTRFGSGWAWLVLDKNKKLKIISTANQDSPIMDDETPILCLDVWEHAYYLKYQNKRVDYINSFFKVINWEKVSQLFEVSK